MHRAYAVPSFTSIDRHFPCRKRNTLSVARVACPSTTASQMSMGCKPRTALRIAHMPSGTTICDTMEMNSGLFVSPVHCSPPV